MILPLRPELPLRRAPWVTSGLVVLNVLIHAVLVVLSSSNPDLYSDLINRFAVVRGGRFEWYQLLTSAFLHGGLLHLAGNMVFLNCFGGAVEDRFGSIKFLVFYVLAAAASGAVHMLASPAPAIGASGAIAGVTGAFLVLFPKTTIRSFYLLGGIIGVPAWWIIGLGIAWNLIFFNSADNVARAAHLGGYGFGFGIAMLLLWLKVLPRQPYDLFSSAKQAHRRRQFKAAAEEIQKRTAHVQHTKKLDERSDRLAESRARVSTAIAEGDLPQAVVAYRELCNEFALDPSATTLSRNAQYRLANHMVTTGLHAEAANAWTRFLEAYHTDAEADAIRVLLARLLVDHLADPGQARQQLERVLSTAAEGDIRTIAQADLDSLNATHPQPPAADAGA